MKIGMLEPLTLKPKAFGLDISDFSLKIIQLKEKGDYLGLASFGEVPIKPGVIERGEIRNEEALAEVIKNALSQVKGEKLKTNYVIASLPEEKAFLQVIQLPLMKEKEVKKAVYFEAENYVPLPIGEVYLDSQIVLPVENRLDHRDVLIAALPKKTVDPYLSSLKKAGLKPKVLEIESQAVSRALILEGMSPSPVLLIDLGANRTGFSIFSGYSLRFTSSVPISSREFTEEISRKLRVSFEKAEELKMKFGVERNGEKVLEVLTPSLAELVNQIKKYLNFYQTHASHEHLSPGSGKLEKIILCGGGANLKGLTDFLSSELKLRVELGNPWLNILPRPLKEVPELPYKESLRFTTALGLALRGIKEK